MRIQLRLCSRLVELFSGAAQGAILACLASSSLATAAFAGQLNLDVRDAVSGDPISTYRYIINVDNTGTTEQRAPEDGCSPSVPGYPATCHWTSIAGVPGSSPIFTQGDQSDANTILLPSGRYLISVRADTAQAYKLDGTHFTVTGDVPVYVTVRMQPTPLPTATIQAAVFEDISPVNGAPDLPAEHGLAGFQGHIADYLAMEVTTDVFGNPICSEYDAAGALIPGSGGICLSKCYVVVNGADVGTVPPDADGRCPTATAAGETVEGKLKIPNLGTNRYALSITPPDGQRWLQTTTLEGNLDWDAWVMEGATGLDTEFMVAGEPFPAIIFGYVRAPAEGQSEWRDPALPSGTGSISGTVEVFKAYVPPKGGIGIPNNGIQGGKLAGPIDHPWVTLSDLTRGDTIVWVGQGGADGRFIIAAVPPGNYTLTWWDENLDYILDLMNVTVGAGENVDMGYLPMLGWWTRIDGYVFNDTNGNGVMDPGEPGLPNYPVVLKKRENSVMDRGGTVVMTDASGHYLIENGYPMTQWLVEEAYDDLHYTTGVTYQADNQVAPTTVLGAGVDVSVLPIIGLSGRLDWGKKAYPRGTNGGIVGTVSYDTTRNELDPRFAAVEFWQPGISNLRVNLWQPLPCVAGQPCSAGPKKYALAPDGSIAKGKLLNVYITETWARPTGCVARDVDGNPLTAADQQVLPAAANAECLEGPLMGVQFAPYGTDQGTPDANFGATVDGNYGFGDGCFDGTLDATDPASPVCTGGSFTPLTPADYLVEVEVPTDAFGKPLYRVTREEDINIFTGDEWAPQIPPPECAGPLHTVDVAGVGTDGYPEVSPIPGVIVPPSTPTENPDFAGGGGSPYEGQQKPLCSTKLVRVSDGRSTAPGFNFFTDVPLPGRLWGLLVDDLNFSGNPRSLLYGEKAGIPFAPVGVYDFTNRLVATVESDFNGLWDVLLPSTNRISCPTPSGVCANLYRFVGNDPGVPGRLNPNYRPEYRTIAAEFEVFPGLLVPADLAPTRVGVSVQLPGGQTNTVACALDPATPQLFAVDRPWVENFGSFHIYGQGFGTSRGQGKATLDGVPLQVDSWSATELAVTVPAGTPRGPHQLQVTADNRQSTVNGLTFHVIGATYRPTVIEVGPGRTFQPAETLPAAADHAIQNALDAAPPGALVVVYPNLPTLGNPRQNPRGAYYENLIISKPVKLQGVGPGGVRADGSTVRGSIIDGGAFGGDSPVVADWITRIGTMTWDGNQTPYDGAVISIFAQAAGPSSFPISFTSADAPRIDGFDLRGGDQQGFPGNINVIGGGPTGAAPGITTQGGAIFANGFARNLQVTNNVVQNNGGGYGTMRFGTPDLPAPNTSNHNEQVRIANNRIIGNAGTNLAGAIGLFNGSDGYEVAHNDICGNFSAEYGGGISALGLSPNGSIHHNRIYFNNSYDEGGGILIAGALPAATTQPSPGSGPVNVYNNLIQANLSNDDGGGIRFLMAGNFPMNVYNNFIVNNVSAHEGGGISLNDAPNVRIYNNTIMKNLTTATAVTSDGMPMPAGLSTSQNSTLLQATLPPGSPTFSRPMLFNDIFWDNRAGTRTGQTVTGLGNDPSPIDHFDMGVADGTGLLAPTNSILQDTTGTVSSATNRILDPHVLAPYDVSVAFNVWRNNPAFISAILVAVDLPPNLMGDYHIPLDGNATANPALNAGAASKTVAGVTVAAPLFDYDDQGRPAVGGFDIGADESRGSTADLAIALASSPATILAGGTVTYTITVTNLGPDAASGATVVDTLPASLTGASWSCSGTGCPVPATGTGNLSRQVSLSSGGSVVFTLTAAVPPTPGTLTNTATVGSPVGSNDPNPANNTATDIRQITLPLPTLALLDSFNRPNANDLGANWAQPLLPALRVDTNQVLSSNALLAISRQAVWNTAFGAKQGAALTLSNGTTVDAALMLKATGGTAALPATFLRVRCLAASVSVERATNSGLTTATIATFAGACAANDTLVAVANTNGSVDVWRSGVFLGRSAATASTGTGRIGIYVPVNGRADDFRGGTLP